MKSHWLPLLALWMCTSAWAGGLGEKTDPATPRIFNGQYRLDRCEDVSLKGSTIFSRKDTYYDVMGLEPKPEFQVSADDGSIVFKLMHNRPSAVHPDGLKQVFELQFGSSPVTHSHLDQLEHPKIPFAAYEMVSTYQASFEGGILEWKIHRCQRDVNFGVIRGKCSPSDGAYRFHLEGETLVTEQFANSTRTSTCTFRRSDLRDPNVPPAGSGFDRSAASPLRATKPASVEPGEVGTSPKAFKAAN